MILNEWNEMKGKREAAGWDKKLRQVLPSQQRSPTSTPLSDRLGLSHARNPLHLMSRRGIMPNGHS